jgi:sterol 14-demethylase
VRVSSPSSSEANLSLVYLTQNREWKDKVEAELQTFKKENVPSNYHGTLSEALAEIPLSLWESQFRAFDMCLQETVRLVTIGCHSRRNIGEDTVIEGRVLRHGDFVLLMTEDANFNEEFYDDARSFKPDRDMTKALGEPISVLSWGYGQCSSSRSRSKVADSFHHLSGNYACPGQRFAKALLKLIIVMAWLTFDFELVNAAGKPVAELPEAQRELFAIGLPKEKVALKFRKK